MLSLVRRGVQNIIIVDAEHDPDSSYKSAKKLRDALARELGLDLTIDPPRAAHDVDSPRQAVLTGKITGWKDAEGKPLDPLVLIYIKLSMDREQLAQPSMKPEELPDYGHEVTQQRDRSPDFPQRTTADLSYTPAQFRAYRQLGYDLVCHEWSRAQFEILDVEPNATCGRH